MGAFLVTAGAFAAFAMPANPAGVTVLGAVKSPGLAAISGPMSLGEVVRQSGGFEVSADRSLIEIRRADGTTATVDATRLGRIPAVRPGDVVLVPRLDTSKYVFVEGGVANAGAKRFRKGMTLLDTLAEAKPVKGAAVETIRLYRMGPEGTLKVETFDLNALLASASANVELNPSDRVEVPYMAAPMSDRELITIAVIVLLILVIAR